MSAARCTKCKGLLPAWLEAGNPSEAKCPNCGHINDLAAARTPPPVRTPAPQPQAKPGAKSTNAYTTLESQGATKSPSLNKTMMMGSGDARIPELKKAVGMAKTMMAMPAPAPTPAPEAKPQKRVPTLPSLGTTEMLPAPSLPATAAAKPATPPPVRTPPPMAATTPMPVVASPPPPTPGATPQVAPDTDVDISVEMDTPPPAPASKTSLPEWAVASTMADIPSEAISVSPVAGLLRQHTTKIAAGAVGLVGLVIVVVLLTRGGKHREPVTVEVRPPAHENVRLPEPEPAPAPVAAEPVKTAPAPKAAPARAEVARKPAEAPRPVEAPRPRPVAAAAAPAPAPASAPAAAPERKVMVASAKHVAAATATGEPARRAGQPTEEDQRLAKEAYARGNAQLFQGHVDEAINAFKESLKLDARNPAAQRGLGLAYVQAGNAQQAVVYLKKYLRSSPTASDRPLIEKRIEQLSAR